MRTQPLVLLSALAALAVATHATARAQEVTYEKYRLDNGLTVILHEDHSLPVTVINTWFHVGSKDEAPGRSGFAHLFEHLMFMGTERVPEGQFDAIMEAGGGFNNASTDYDRTNYYSQGPSELLPTLLWLDADRLEDLGRMMTQEKLDLQRDVVRNERRQTTENVPYGKAEDQLFEMLFPDDHPYHHSVIGTHEDLEAATLQDVKDFFANFYVPNNASLVVAGDFDPAAIKPVIERMFGSIPRGADPLHAEPRAFKLKGVQRRTTVDNVQFPLVRMGWVSPRAFQDGDAELDIAAQALGDGKSARLYTRLVKDEQLAIGVDASQDSLLVDSVFVIDVTAKPGADLDRIERIVDEEVARMTKDGPSAEEVERIRAQEEAGTLARMQGLLFRADQMNEYEFYFGEPDSFRRDLDRYRKASPESVRAAAARVLDPEARAILRVLPDQPEHAASDRDTRPADLAPAPFAPPAPQTFALDNGVEVQVFPREGVPLVQILVQFATGAPLDPAGKEGRAALLADMLLEGAAGRSAEEFETALETLGANLGVGAEHLDFTLSMSALRRNLDPSVALLADALFRPNMKTDDFARARALRVQSIAQEDDEPSSVAARVAYRTYFGAEHPFGMPSEGTQESVAALTLDDMTQARAQLLKGGNARVILVGDIDAAAARALVERALGGLEASPRAPTPDVAKPVAAAAAKATSDGDAPRVFLVHRPGAVQTVVRFLSPGIGASDGRRVTYQALAMLLGGSFTSRLVQNLREDKGYTYGARTGLDLFPGVGAVSTSSSVRADVTGASLKEFLAEFARLRAGDVSPGEAEKATASVRSRVVGSFETYRGIAGRAANLALAGLPFTTVGDDLAALQDCTAPALNAAAKDFLTVRGSVLVLVGDRDVVLPQLVGLGLPDAVELDVNGRPVAER